MCFSAQASFIVGATLTVAGVATLQRVASWREVPLAASPLLFAGQQFVEGALWLRLGSGTNDAVTVMLVHSFLLFALVLWPVLVPIAALLVEPQPRRRRVMALFVLWGLAVGGYLLVCMILWPYEATIYSGHILYSSEMKNAVGSEYIYLLGVGVPLILSSHRMLMLMGIVGAVLLAFTKYYASATYVSVWCYFAAVTSIMVVAHFYARADLRGGLGRNAGRGERVDSS